MPRKRTSSEDQERAPAELATSREDARARLEDRIGKGREIRGTRIQGDEQLEAARQGYYKWDSFNEELLKRSFTTDEYAKEYAHSFGFGVISIHEPSLGEKTADFFENVDRKIHKLQSIVERLELIPIANAVTLSAPPSAVPADTKTNKVFIVHGHDEAAKTSLEVLLHELGLDPIVLHRQPDQGLTVIEKFEKHSDVGYAFVLLTPDEVAYLSTDESKSDEQRKKENRARPNVIFEFGYFVGKLGRSRVCCLYTGGVTLPSDVNGIIYKRYKEDIAEVAYSITKDLKASGYKLK